MAILAAAFYARPAMTQAPPHEPGALQRRLDRYLALRPPEREAVRALERNRTMSLRAGEALVTEAHDSTDMFVLQSGWLYTSTALPGGARQILRIHHPGDLVNMACVAWSRVAATATAGSDIAASAFPRAALAEVFRSHPRLAALLFGLGVMADVALSDRLKSLGRTDGRARIAALLLELLSRQRAGGGPPDTLDLFLNQSEIGDALGLTKVHVNRLLRAMTEEGLIERQGRRVRIPDPEALGRIGGFVDRFAEMATDWLPPAVDPG